MSISTQIVTPAGYVRSYRGCSEEEQERELHAYGVTTIYRASEGHTPQQARGRFRRKGEMLAVAGRLRVLGEKRREIVAAVDYFHEKGFAILDIQTGDNSLQHGVRMFDSAWSKLNAEVRVPDLKKASEYGKLGGRQKGVNAEKRLMPKAAARVFWEDWETYTEEEALERMTGWSRAKAYDRIGQRGAPRGRRPSS